jgi:hypothetical protein
MIEDIIRPYKYAKDLTQMALSKFFLQAFFIKIDPDLSTIQAFLLNKLSLRVVSYRHTQLVSITNVVVIVLLYPYIIEILVSHNRSHDFSRP